MYTKLNTGIVSKRTGKNTVAIVGFANTTRDLAPWEDEETEIWGLNEAYSIPFMKRWTRWFQLHTEVNFNREDNPNDPNHAQWLREKHGKPIYLQEKYEYIPDAVKYPLAEVIEAYGKYLTSSFAFMLALAMLEGFERIEIYGFEMGTHTEYHYQKANAEYLIGLALGSGFEIYMPEQCSLCKGKMYGFESMDVPFRQTLEYRKISIEDELKKQRDLAMIENGKMSRLEEDIQITESEKLREVLDSQQEQYRLAAGRYNFLSGTLVEIKEIIKHYDKFLESVGVIPNQDYTSHEVENAKAT